MATWSDNEDEVSYCSDVEEDIIAFVAFVEGVSSDNDEVTLNDVEKMSYQEQFAMYGSLFNETCVAKLDNVELNLKVIELWEDIESLWQVRTNMSEKVISLEAQIKVPYERRSICGDEGERDDLIVVLEAQVQELMVSQETLLRQLHLLKTNNEI